MTDNPQSTGKENQERSHLSLTREQLYELVWSKPMQHLAKDYGVSDHTMAKLCARNQVPVPPRGYWARKNSGYKVVRPPLPAFIAKEKPKPKPPEPEVQKPAKKKAKPSSAWEDREKKIKQILRDHSDCPAAFIMPSSSTAGVAITALDLTPVSIHFAAAKISGTSIASHSTNIAGWLLKANFLNPLS